MKKPFNINPKDTTVPCTRCHKTQEEGARFNKNNRGFRFSYCQQCLKIIWQKTSDKNVALRKRYKEAQRERMEKLYSISPAEKCPAPEGERGQWMRYTVRLGYGPTVIYCPEKGLKVSLATTHKRMTEGMHRDIECTKFFVQSSMPKMSDPVGGGMHFNGRTIIHS